MRRLFILVVLSAACALGADAGVKAAPVFVPVEVVDVIETDEGLAVLLLERKEGLALPIMIGPNEALAISLRLQKKMPPRPLTHDLLEEVITRLGGRLVRVEIDDLQANTFLGRVVIARGKQTVTLDARSSDAIALALGLGAPIQVSRAVLDRAGLSVKDMGRKTKPGPQLTPETL